MEGFLDILEYLSKYPEPPAEWEKEDLRSKPFFSQVVRNAMPGLSSTQRERLVNYVGPLLGKQFRERFKGISQSGLIQIARDLQKNKSFQKTLEYYKSTYEKAQGVPLSEVDAGAVQVDNQPAPGPNKLRARSLLPTKLALRETPLEQIKDVALANQFDFRTPNEELGQNNALYADNLQNEALRFMQPLGVPRRPDDLERLVATAPVVPQWTDDAPVEDAIHDRIRDGVVREGLRSLPPISVALQDNVACPDPYGNYRPYTVFEPVNDLGPGYRPDFTQRVEFGELDRRGFKPDYDPMRGPRESSRLLPVTPIQTAQEQLRQVYSQGYDSTFHTGWAEQPPNPGPIDLRGFQWME
jgi:hypothetical protein